MYIKKISILLVLLCCSCGTVPASSFYSESSVSSSESSLVHVHTFDKGTTILSPTSVETGLKEYKCSECGYVKEETVEPLDIEYKTIKGNYEIGDYLVSTEQTNLVVVDNITIPHGTVSTNLNAYDLYDAGIIFNAKEDLSSYYSLFMNSEAGNSLNLVKHTNNEDVVLDGIYITSIHKCYEPITLKVDYFNGDLKCFYNEMMLITYNDTDYLEGDVVGFFTKNIGTSFGNIYLSRERVFKTVETLIIGHSYMDLWNDYKEDLSRYHDIANIGIGGSHTALWLSDHVDEIIAYQPKKLIYCIGINDFPYPPTYILDNVKGLVNKVVEALPDIRICIMSVNKAVTHMQFNSLIDQYNSLLRTYVEDTPNLVYGDMDNAYLDDGGYPIASYFIDGLHPNKEGYKILADAIYKAFGDIESI